MNKHEAQKIIQKTQDDYNRIASQFDSTRKYNWRDIAKVIEDLKIKKGSEVLDLGCGGGRLYELLEKYEITYTGIDLSDELVKIAKNKYPKAKFTVGDITGYNSDKKYDYVFCIAALHHIPSKELREKSIENIKNALNINGNAVVSVWYFWNQWKYVQEIIKQFLGISSFKFRVSNHFFNPKLRNPNLNQNSKFKIQNSCLTWGDFYIPWKNQKGETLAERYHHAWTARELKKNDFKIVSKNKNLIGIYQKTI